jgi:hypothetical protein
MAAAKHSDRPNGRDRRRWSRYDVTGALPAALVIADRRIFCRIENVSLTGARLRLAEPAPPSAQLRLEYRGGRAPAGRCVWSTPDSIGVSFGFSDESVALAMACLRLPAPQTPSP